MGLADSFFDFCHDAIDWDSPLLHRIAFSDGDGSVDECLAIDGDAVGRTDFVLSPVAFSDRCLFIVEDIELLFESSVDFGGDFRHAVFLDQRQDGGFVGSYSWVESHHDARLELTAGLRGLDFGVSLAEECQHGSIGPGRGFDDMGGKAFACQIVPVG